MAGHITKRKRGDSTKWRARYPDPTRGGTAQIERTFDTKREAERWLTEQKSAVQRGVHIDPANSGRLLGHVAGEWRGTWTNLEPKTKAGYETILNKHVLPRWQDARIGAVSADAIQKWVNELAKSGRAPATVRRIYGVLQSIMKLAIRRNYITVNPCADVSLPRANTYAEGSTEKEMQFLTAAEVTAIAEAIKPFYRVLVYTAAYSGLRSGELGALRRRDVDLLHGKLHVSPTRGALKIVETASENIADEDKGVIFGPPKSGKGRVVGIPRFLVAMLTEHLETIPADPDALIFTSPEGEPRRQGNFYRRHFKPTVRRRYCASCSATVKPDADRCPGRGCGSDDLRYVIPPSKHALRFHDLRHTCASLLIAANAHPKAIQDHLGHADIQTTFNVYGHLLPQAHDALSAALDSAYAGSADQDDDAQDIPRIGRG
jgi:integrase